MSTSTGRSEAKEGSGFWKSLFQSNKGSSQTSTQSSSVTNTSTGNLLDEWNTEQIGDTAGLIWQFLDDNGPTGVEVMVDRMELPRDLLMQSIGWLAREGKLSVQSEDEHQTVSLCE